MLVSRRCVSRLSRPLWRVGAFDIGKRTYFKRNPVSEMAEKIDEVNKNANL